MRSFVLLMLLVWLGSTAAGWAQAAGGPPPQPLPLNATDVDYTGTWNYTTSNHQVSGICPNGAPMAGTLSITQEDALAQVLVVSGAICDPAFTCIYSGVVEGGDLVVANSGIVDEEGGTVTNELRLFFFSEDSAGGSSTSVYSHPKGFSCTWTHSLTLARSGR